MANAFQLAPIWEKCVKLEKCVKIGWPINKEWCIGVKVCLRIVLRGGKYYLEVDVNGKTIRKEISKQCFPIFSISIGEIKICITPISKGVRIEAQACLDVGPFDDCWRIYGVDVKYIRLAAVNEKARGGALRDLLGDDLGEIDEFTHFVVDHEFDVSGVAPCANCS